MLPQLSRRVDLAASLGALMLANLVPLAGVLWFGWDLSGVMLLYWAENVIVGLYTLVRLGVIARWGALPMGLFFCVHYGMFMFVHLVFIYAITEAADWSQVTYGEGASFSAPSKPDAPFLPTTEFLAQTSWIGLAALVVSHGVSFVRHFLLGPERRTDTAEKEMGRPYGRMVVMHVAIIAGAFVVAMLQEPVGLLVVLISLKIAIDAASHVWEHRRAG